MAFKKDRKNIMSNLIYYFWLILLIIYIISPFDIHPLFLDDLIAAGVLFYLLYKNAKQKKQRESYYSQNQSQENKKTESEGHFSLGGAYRLLGVNPDASMEEVKKAYKEKVTKSHPDKVNHLSEELQEKAKELTLKLNKAIDIIERSKIS